MRIMYWVVGVVASTALFIACGNPSGTPTAPTSTQPFASISQGAVAATTTGSVSPMTVSAGPMQRQVAMMDACDGPTFNAAIGPGTCARTGGVNFSEFVAQLTAHHSVGAWHNAPSQTDAWVGDSLIAVNKGGETHTMTRVAQFGGGVVPFLNDLAGTPNIAPECTTETTFVPPGGTDREELNQAGELMYQCCIHPWMRTTVLVKSH
jgi:plastocyanin